MSTEITTQSMSADERKRLWDEVAADEAAGITRQPTAPSQDAAATTAVEASAAQAQPAQQTGQPAQTEQTTERFAGIPQEVRDYLAGLETKVEQLSGRMRSNEGSIGGLKLALQRQREAAQAVRDAGGAAPTESQIREAQAGGKRALDKLKETYPEFADQLSEVLKEELADVRGTKAQEQPGQGQAQQGDQTVSVEEAVAIAKRDAYIEAKGFPGYQERIKQPDFVGWFQRQPAEIQMLGYSPDPAHAVRLLEIHRDQAKTAAGGQQGLERFAGVSEIHRSGQSAQRGVKTVDQMTRAEYWAYLNEQDKQQSQQR